MNRCYLSVFVIFRSRFLKLFMLVSLMCLITCACSSKEQINYDVGTYLSGDTDFEKNVATVLPSKQELANSEVVYYMYYDNGGNTDSSESKMIRLTVKYSDDEIVKAARTIEQLHELHNNETMSKRFYYNGILYDAHIFYNIGYCAFAYHVCLDSNTISYIAFDHWFLEYMDVELALGNFPQFECKEQIISYK